MQHHLIGAVSVALLSAPAAARAQHEHHEASTAADAPIEAAADAAMAATGVDVSRHLRLTVARPGTAADSARARALVDTLRKSLAKYRDVKVAEADGYRQFAPRVKMPRIYHFTRRAAAVKAQFTFDPTAPTSLLYRKDASGGFQLVGVMYTAPNGSSEEKLNARVPLSIARWHQHVNVCVPKRRERERWTERSADGRPKFGPAGTIATEEACRAENGRWRDRVLNWMVHANVFESDDPAVIWGDHQGRKGHAH